ncbi:MAG TPA: amidohydrolase family protein [Candidatus Dormibacteraeota bacterium]|nr:amidohydrolase family protein [Candidatus Dormibacteraeota bacterium]
MAEHEYPGRAAPQPIADCDVHEGMRSITELLPYLPPQWHMYFNRDSLSRLPAKHPYLHPQGGTRLDLIHPDNSSDDMFPDRVREQLLDRYGITCAMLVGTYVHQFTAMPQGKFAAALATAYNDWLIDRWLSFDPRFKGSVAVAAQEPQLAAQEIDRVGGHPSMVQVNLPMPSPQLPWGHERYYPIWEAAVRNNLRVAMHVSPPAGLLGAPSVHGWATSYMELRCQYVLQFQSGLLSLVCNGVFERFPELRIVLLEGGFSWVPGLMWRLDQSWGALRREVPWLKRPPSEYVREHVRFGTQPMEEPPDPKHLLQLVDMMGSDRMLMFATDYPHWDFDDPGPAIPKRLPADLRRKILWDNARDFYGFPEPAQTSPSAVAV